ncbi:beta-lactamase family protein [Mesorhizobium sp. B4-1-3]|uniref:serine hydrolase domain-containing protein n=1 Tax=Mesorhizobium sp. B4-1-3 TaxID=2589889 RepID=UPI00112D979E|nr:serine hydrolase domain-containing protein [Mesorhizobium sp. B4-1-3]TPI13039.1 beta-lactamase family protein [Mesorhizobium sp. B4-1-3]
MTSTRRSLLKAGVAGLLTLPRSYASASQQGQSFESWRRDFEASVPARLNAAKVPGAAVAIASKKGGTRYATAFGFADIEQMRKLTPETPMHLASVSKLFTASALVQLFERRRLDLHSDVNTFIDFPVRNPRHPRIPITPHQLITHTSSISDEGYGDVSFPGDPKQSLSSFLKDYLVKGGATYSQHSFLNAEPGAKWDYCNVAVALAGYVVEHVSKQSFSSYVETNILQPLGIHNAHWYLKDFAPNVLAKPYELENGRLVALPQQGYPDVPAGMLRCSVSDLASSLRAMIGADAGERAILSERAVAEMLRRQVDPKIYAYQGLGWTEEETTTQKFVGHSGSDNGALNMVALTGDRNHAVAVLLNVDGTPATSSFRASMVDDLLVGAKLA